MTGDPLQVIEKWDPELIRLVRDNRDFVFAEGALPRKFKLLVAMALDASKGAVGGVAALARMAMEAGATREEVAEALRVAQYVCGVGSVYTAAHAFEDLP